MRTTGNKGIKMKRKKETDKSISKKWIHFNWFIFGIILMTGIGLATTVNE